MNEKSYKYSPHEPEEIDNLITGSYDRFIQLERRNLLLISFLVIFSSIANINPDKVSILGLTFENFGVTHFYSTLVVLVVYFLSAFVIYGYPNYRIAKKTKGEISKKAMTITRTVRRWHIEWPRLRIDLKYISWLFFHYLLPVVLGLASVIVGVIKIV